MSRLRSLVLAAAAAFPLSFAAAQTFTPPRPLSGDLAISASAESQGRQRAAFSGSSTLVVWEDDRSSAIDSVYGGQNFSSSVPGNRDIYGAFVDEHGQPLSSAPIAIDLSSWDQTNPRVAWNGTHFLVVYESTRPTTFYRSVGIYAVRVSASGAVLDSPALLVANDENYDELSPCVTAVGPSWIVAWNGTDANGYSVLFGRTVSSAGQLGARRTLVPYNAATGAPIQAEMAGTAQRGMLIWSRGGGNGIEAQALDAAAQPVSTVTTLASGRGLWPTVATNGSDFYVTWFDSGLRGTPLSAAAVPAIAGGVLVVPAALNSVYSFASAFDGTQWVVAIDSAPTVHAVHVAPSGTPQGSPRLIAAPGTSVPSITLADGNGSALVLWSATTVTSWNTGTFDIHAARLDASGAIGAARDVSASPPTQINPRLAGDAHTGYLIVYESAESARRRILGRLVDAEGTPAQPEPFEIYSGDHATSGADVAWNGSEFLVTWTTLQTNAHGGPPPLVFARRVRADGTLLDATPITVMEGSGARVAALGSSFLVVARFQHPTLQYQAAMRCRRVDGPTGTLLDQAPQMIQVGAGGSARVVALRDRWLVVFGTVIGVFVLANGTPQAPFTAGLAYHSSTQTSLCASRDGNSALLIFERKLSSMPHPDVRARRIDLQGNSLDPLEGLPVSSATHAQIRPVAADLDGAYLCAWADHRDHLEYEPGLGDVFAARLDGSGSLLDPNGLPVLDTPRAEGAPALLRTGLGRALLVACALDEATNSQRLRVSLYRDASAEPWSLAGTALGGARGRPVLEGYGPLRGGTLVDVAIENAAAGAPGVLVLGRSAANLPLLGGVLVPFPEIALPFVTDALGAAHIAATWPFGASGAVVYLQAWIVDPSAPQAVAATNGVRAIAP
ncbi:MAG: hypothetical protein JNM84_23680 [Planctomycetes bacterium]|nr:hypothetical protein [Planctomycetota bacterium]